MQLKNYYSLESNVEAEKKLKNSFNIPFIVPSKYQVNQSNETFFGQVTIHQILMKSNRF